MANSLRNERPVAIRFGDERRVDYTCEQQSSTAPGDGNPLIMAAREGRSEIVASLLERGARVNEMVPDGENALIQESGEGHPDVVKLLVTRGADVNARVWVGR